MTENEKKVKEEMEKEWGKAPEIDLSLVQNLNAAKQTGTVSEKAAKNIQSSKKEKKAKFCFTEEHEIELPTKGYLYKDQENEDIKNGIVRLQPMSIDDEETISNQSYIKNGTVFTHLLNSCILNEGFDARNLCVYDVYYLIYALRQITYGEDYKFELKCPSCGKKYDFNLNVGELTFDELKSSETLTKKITLPVSKYTITIRAEVLGDEESAYKLSKRFEDFNDTILKYVSRTSEVLSNNGEAINPDDWPEFYKALPGRDRATITSSFKNIEDLRIPTITCTCPKCGEQEERTIPFNKEFFRY